jgi:hypothetical protein
MAGWQLPVFAATQCSQRGSVSAFGTVRSPHAPFLAGPQWLPEIPWLLQAAVSGGHGRAPAPSSSSSSAAGGSTAGERVRAVYPRVDPAVIVAATCGDWLLLGRKRSWDQGRYSLLAGEACFCALAGPTPRQHQT